MVANSLEKVNIIDSLLFENNIQFIKTIIMQLSNQIEIDVSNSNDEDDLIDIRLEHGEILQLNFYKFVKLSKKIREQFKYSEAIKSIQTEIDKVEKEMNIDAEGIKLFIQLIQEERIIIPNEHYRNIYTLSTYFIIPKFTSALDQIMAKKLCNDLTFSIQILHDSESSSIEIDSKLTIKIENFLKARVNECIEHSKFGELSISTIYRILEGSERGSINQNSLVDFILKSVETRFTFFKFIDIEKLSEDKIDEFLEFIEEQDEEKREIYVEHIPFSLFYIKEMKKSNDKLLRELELMRQKLNQNEEEFNSIKRKLIQKDEELNDKMEEFERTQIELKQLKDESNQKRNEIKHYAQSIMVGGYAERYQFGEKPNSKDKNGNIRTIHPPLKIPFEPSSLQSISFFYEHSVIVTNSGSLLGAGNNSDGRISATLPKTEIKQFTEFSIEDSSGCKMTPISAVCCNRSTLYMFAKGSGRQLVYCSSEINSGNPVFLDIGNVNPVSLFGGYSHSAAIDDKGEVIFINLYSVKNSLSSRIEAVSLPDGEKAVSVACCESSIVVLSSTGRVFESAVTRGSGILSFSVVKELAGQEIVWISGKYGHFLAVNKEGRVFGRGSNYYGRLCFNEETRSVLSFTEISSLGGYKITAASAGIYHSFFVTGEGKVISCGYNYHCELLLSRRQADDVYSPAETMIANGCTFCIAGQCVSAVFLDGCPPPNTPNMITHYQK